MPRLTELVGWGFAVQDWQTPVADENGQPTIGDGGQLQMAPGKLLVLIDPQTGEQIRIGLSEGARDELVRQLAGGVVVAKRQPAMVVPRFNGRKH